jgi:hypothetical protein
LAEVEGFAGWCCCGTAVIIRGVAHGYDIVTTFVPRPDGATQIISNDQYGGEDTSIVIAELIGGDDARHWLATHEYDRASRRDVGRVASLELYDAAGVRQITFNRSSEVIDSNPVNSLIDRCNPRSGCLIPSPTNATGATT